MTDLSAWSTRLPPSWEAKPLKAIASYLVSNVDKIPSEDELPVRLCNYTDVYNNEFISPTMDFMHATAAPHEIARFRLEVNDVVITKDSESWDDIAVPALVVGAADDLVCGYHLAVLRPLPSHMLGRFLFRCLQSGAIRLQLELAATGITRFGLPKDEIGKLLLPVPPTQVQERIADYLDAETAQIDALLAEKERMLALIQEKRAALVSRLVTRGPDPCAPLKPSGIEWLGEIPAHWKVRRGKYLFRQSELAFAEEDQIVTCFRNGEVTLRKNRREEGFTNAEKESSFQGIRAGQLVLHSMDAFAGAIGVSDSNGKCSLEYVICDPVHSSTSSRYYGYLLRVMALRGFILAACPAVRQRAPRIRFSDITEMFLPVPSLQEQESVVRAIRSQEEEAVQVEAMLRRSITLLKERRGALITAAVTGQLSTLGTP